MALGPLFISFVAQDTGLKFDDISMKILGPSQILNGLGQIGRLPSFSSNNSRMPDNDSRDPETETRGLAIEKKVYRIFPKTGTTQTGYGPTQVGRRGEDGMLMVSCFHGFMALWFYGLICCVFVCDFVVPVLLSNVYDIFLIDINMISRLLKNVLQKYS